MEKKEKGIFSKQGSLHGITFGCDSCLFHCYWLAHTGQLTIMVDNGPNSISTLSQLRGMPPAIRNGWIRIHSRGKRYAGVMKLQSR